MNSMIARNLIYYPLQALRGEFVFKYLKEMNVSQWVPLNRIKIEQFKKMKKLLQYAYTNIPFYQQMFSEYHMRPERITKIDDWGKLPTIAKRDLQERRRDLFPRQKNIMRICKKTTGGSTGEPVTVYKTADAMARARAAMYRGYGWFGINPGDKQARFWGVSLIEKERRKYQIIDALMNRKRFSAFKFKEEDLITYAKVLRKFKPKYFYGYVSMLVEFAHFLNKTKIDATNLFSIEHIITTSEVLNEWQRGLLMKTFACSVQNEYGCGEIGPIACECPNGKLHINSENIYVELEESNDFPGVYEIIITELNNFYMPLIRYRIGDYTYGFEKGCPCGRGLPVIVNILGREYDFIEMKDGYRFHGEQIMYMFENLKKANIPIMQFQVVQNDYDDFKIHLILSDKSDTKMVVKEVEKVFEQELCTCSINTEIVDHIEREKSGKIRVIKNNMTSRLALKMQPMKNMTTKKHDHMRRIP